MSNNPLTAALRARTPIIGAFCGLPTSMAAELTAAAGYDYVCVDLQHGLADFGDLPPMFAAISSQGATPMARVPANEPWMIMRALDLGAMGVIVPMIDSAADAARAVSACRYPESGGGRSFGPVRSGLVMGSREPADVEDVACIVMIETAEGLANVAEIAATPGVDALYVGPNDLSLAIGLPPGYERPEPEHEAAIERIRAAAMAGGVAAGIQCSGGPAARHRREQGFSMTTVGSDHNWLRIAAAAELAAAGEAG